MSKNKHYIFGYGSLISTDSRKRTSKSDQTINATLKGYKRGWYVHIDDQPATAVGIKPSNGHKCNGIITQIDPDELPKFDQREIEYERIQITPENFENHKLPANAIIWTYTIKSPAKPLETKPICQSYVDTIIAGCLEYSIQEALNFIHLTDSWNKHWLNDRANPTYTKHVSHPPIDQIDELLSITIPDVFKHRYDI